jgi:hypothetical protein
VIWHMCRRPARASSRHPCLFFRMESLVCVMTVHVAGGSGDEEGKTDSHNPSPIFTRRKVEQVASPEVLPCGLLKFITKTWILAVR